MSAAEAPAPTPWQAAAARREFRPAAAELRRRMGHAEQILSAAEIERVGLLCEGLCEPLNDRDLEALNSRVVEVEQEMADAKLEIERAQLVLEHLP